MDFGYSGTILGPVSREGVRGARAAGCQSQLKDQRFSKDGSTEVQKLSSL